ncbi:MAG: glycosyltransferase [Bacteroidetes bacterium]|nr:glycosyltransferase [Bacteroidota bacterium]
MKHVLVISPNFPPVNAADMHRIRQSLGYFEQFGWKATVVAVKPEFVEMGQDPLLVNTLPADAEVYYINAFRPQTTRKFGLGNLGYRSLLQYNSFCSRLIRKRKFDLVYFTTTQFPVMVLGRIWKRKFGLPFILDIQDPWRNDFYLDKPKHERPPKFFFAYRMDKYLEAFTMKRVDGIISVSPAYPKMLMERYARLKPEMFSVIPFGAAPIDFEVLKQAELHNRLFDKDDGNIHCVYIGRGGHDMAFALKGIFGALKKGLEQQPELFGRIRMYFVGTSYAAEGLGQKTILPVAEAMGVAGQVTEITDRLPYFVALKTLSEAQMLVVPGSTDTQYTASKLYPYILANKPMLAVFNRQSSVVEVLRNTRAGEVVPFDNEEDTGQLADKVLAQWKEMISRLPYQPDTDWDAFEPYTAREATRRQVEFFNQIVGQ